MSTTLERTEQLAAFAQQVSLAESPSQSLLSSMIERACQRLQLPSQSENFARLDQLTKAGAFVQAAMALIEFELPQWKIRRLAYDEGAWHCALSRQRELPDWLDDAIETHHADMSLAIVSACLDVLRQREQEPAVRRSTVPRARARQQETMLCENFR